MAHHAPSPISRASSHRSLWLLVDDGRLAERLGTLVPSADLKSLPDGSDLAGALASRRPRLVLLLRPPAGDDDVALLAAERLRHPELRAVLVTPPASVGERVRALELGFDDAYADDMDPTELARRLRILSDRQAGRGPGGRHPLVAGLELDLAAHGLRTGDALVHLRPKELRLLHLLATHPGRVFTRRQLLDRVWGQDHASSARTVDVHVRWLRQKVEPDPHHPRHLLTVRGVGYRFDAALTNH